jgi:GTP-binding protein
MPQTKFVTQRRWRWGCAPSWCSTRSTSPTPSPTARSTRCSTSSPRSTPTRTSSTFPHLYASGRAGWADAELDGPREDLHALFNLVVNHVPPPKAAGPRGRGFPHARHHAGRGPVHRAHPDGPGRIRAAEGRARPSRRCRRIGEKIERFRVSKIQAFRGLALQEIDEAQAGDIVTLAGMSKATVADTICALAVEEPMPAQPIDPPTISVTFGINDSPLAGRDGKKVQSRVIRERLMKEAESERRHPHRRHAGRRGLRGLGPRRIADGRADREHAPRRVRAVDLAPAGDHAGGKRPAVEPIEEVTIDVDDDYTGAVIEKLTGPRKGEMVEMRPRAPARRGSSAHVPSRGLIGYHGEFLTDTRGTGVSEPRVPRLGARTRARSRAAARAC